MKSRRVPQNRYFLFVGLLLLLLPTVSIGANTSTVATVANLYDNFFKPLDNFRALLAPYGPTMVFALVTIHVAAGGLMYVAGTTDPFDLFVQGIKLSIVGGLALAAVTPQVWLGTMTGIGGAVSLPTAIMSGMHTLMMHAANAGATAVSAASGGTSGASWFTMPTATGAASDSSMMAGIFTGIFEALRQLLEVPIFTESNSVWEDLVGMVDGTALAGMVALLYWLGSILMFLLAAALLALELIGADLMIKFAIAFTPLMVPWILFKPMQFLFTGWLKTIVIGSVAFIIGMLLMSGFSAFAATVAQQIATAPTNTWASRVSIAMLFLPLFVGSFMFFMIAQKAMNIANGLVSGSGIEGISLRALGHSMRAANTVTPSSAGAVRGMAANVGNKATSVAAGATAAVRGAHSGITKASGGVAAKTMGGIRGAGQAGGHAATLASPGGQAAAGVAAASGKGQSITPKEFKTAASHANTAYAQARSQGQGHAMAAGAANRAASASLASVTKPPGATRPPVASLSPAAPASVAPAPVAPRRLRKQTP